MRKQAASGSGWSRIINIKDEEEGTEIYMYSDSGRPAGLLIIAGESEELATVDIQGGVPLARFEALVQSTIQFGSGV